MTSITSDQTVNTMSSAPKSRLNWSRIGFLSLNLMAWAGIAATVRVFV